MFRRPNPNGQNPNQQRPTRNSIRISLLPSEWVALEYSFDIGGLHDQIGVTFDFPEDNVKSVKWLGNGPYRVWKNRMKGVSFGIWEKEYNNTVTGESRLESGSSRGNSFGRTTSYRQIRHIPTAYHPTDKPSKLPDGKTASRLVKERPSNKYSGYLRIPVSRPD